MDTAISICHFLGQRFHASLQAQPSVFTELPVFAGEYCSCGRPRGAGLVWASRTFPLQRHGASSIAPHPRHSVSASRQAEPYAPATQHRGHAESFGGEKLDSEEDRGGRSICNIWPSMQKHRSFDVPFFPAVRQSTL